MIAGAGPRPRYQVSTKRCGARSRGSGGGAARSVAAISARVSAGSITSSSSNVLAALSAFASRSAALYTLDAAYLEEAAARLAPGG